MRRCSRSGTWSLPRGLRAATTMMTATTMMMTTTTTTIRIGTGGMATMTTTTMRTRAPDGSTAPWAHPNPAALEGAAGTTPMARMTRATTTMTTMTTTRMTTTAVAEGGSRRDP